LQLSHADYYEQTLESVAGLLVPLLDLFSGRNKIIGFATHNVHMFVSLLFTLFHHLLYPCPIG